MNKEILIVTFKWKNNGGVFRRAELMKEHFSRIYDVEHIFLNSYLKFKLLQFKKIILIIKDFLRYRKKLNNYKIVIAFSNLPSIFSLFSNSNLISVITGSTYHYKEAKFISKVYWILILEPLIYLFSKKIVPAAPHLIPFYVKKSKLCKKVEYINGFIDLKRIKKNIDLENFKVDQFSEVNLENCICLSSGLIGHKGILEFIDIYYEYINKLENNYLKLIIIGDGPLLETCFEFCRKKELNYQFKSKIFNSKNDLFFTGHLKNTLQIIQKCRLFVMPSFHEGLSNQLLEAIYTGIPIIATNCEGNRFVYSEIFKENPDYINSKFLKLLPIINNRNNKSDWVKQLIFYTKNFKSTKYKNSHKLIDNFSSKKNFPKWEIIIRKILEMEEIN